MSRTKKVVEASVTPQDLEDYAEARYRDEVDNWKEVEDVLPQSKKIWKAIADFQSEVPILIQNNQTKNYTYVDLGEIVKVITPLLRKHKLAYIQPLEGKSIKTILFHTETGERIESKVDVPIVELDYMNIYQSIGSAISYYRRYSISSMLNLISEKDTDAGGTQKKVQAPQVQVKKNITDNDLLQAIELIDKGEYTLEKLQKNYYLTAGQLAKLRTHYGTKD